MFSILNPDITSIVSELIIVVSDEIESMISVVTLAAKTPGPVKSAIIAVSSGKVTRALKP